jgi:hypothetical protein
MFGHDDNHSNDTTTVEPSDDGTLAAPTEQPLTALPPADLTSPASASAQSFIATDDKGQPDTSSAQEVTEPHNDLLDIKLAALKQLSPLVGHLDQTPEEKFRTTMMMIQASDDQSLVPQAYAAAKDITDEKTRAQALLDIVNEINYFTQQQQN